MAGAASAARHRRLYTRTALLHGLGTGVGQRRTPRIRPLTRADRRARIRQVPRQSDAERHAAICQGLLLQTRRPDGAPEIAAVRDMVSSAPLPAAGGAAAAEAAAEPAREASAGESASRKPAAA